MASELEPVRAENRLAENQRKAEVRAAKARAAHASVVAKETKRRIKLERADEDLSLARQGLRKNFWGRIVPVRGSSRARPHARRITSSEETAGEV